MQQKLYTPKFSSARHYSLVYLKKINSFLLAFILLWGICFAGFSSVTLACLYCLAYLYKFQKDFCSRCLLSVVPSYEAFTFVQYKIGGTNIVKC